MRIDYDKLYRVSWFDPKGAQPYTSKATSRAAIVTVGMDHLERIFILHSWAAFCGPDVMIDNVFKVNAKYAPLVFGMDATATQNLFADQLRKEAKVRQVHLPLRPLVLRGDKRTFIETVIQPIAAAGRLFRPQEQFVNELKSEWLNFPTGNYRDALDALAHAIDLLPSRPLEETEALLQEQRRRYLIRTGTPEAEIRRRMAQ